jgi:hypothetical protein
MWATQPIIRRMEAVMRRILVLLLLAGIGALVYQARRRGAAAA